MFIPVQCVSVPYKILSLQWLNTRLLGLLSTTEQFHLMDVRTGDQLESLDITNARMVYQTQFFKSLATGGNVSPALSLAGEMAVYGSITSFTNQLLMLGASSIHVLIIRSPHFSSSNPRKLCRTSSSSGAPDHLACLPPASSGPSPTCRLRPGG